MEPGKNFTCLYGHEKEVGTILLINEDQHLVYFDTSKTWQAYTEEQLKKRGHPGPLKKKAQIAAWWQILLKKKGSGLKPWIEFMNKTMSTRSKGSHKGSNNGIKKSNNGINNGIKKGNNISKKGKDNNKSIKCECGIDFTPQGFGNHKRSCIAFKEVHEVRSEKQASEKQASEKQASEKQASEKQASEKTRCMLHNILAQYLVKAEPECSKVESENKAAQMLSNMNENDMEGDFVKEMIKLLKADRDAADALLFLGQ